MNTPPKRIDALRELIAKEGETRLGRAAARELIELIDDGHVTTERAREIRRLRRLGVDRAAICDRLGLSLRQYKRALDMTPRREGSGVEQSRPH